MGDPNLILPNLTLAVGGGRGAGSAGHGGHGPGHGPAGRRDGASDLSPSAAGASAAAPTQGAAAAASSQGGSTLEREVTCKLCGQTKTLNMFKGSYRKSGDRCVTCCATSALLRKAVGAAGARERYRIFCQDKGTVREMMRHCTIADSDTGHGSVLAGFDVVEWMINHWDGIHQPSPPLERPGGKSGSSGNGVAEAARGSGSGPGIFRDGTGEPAVEVIGDPHESDHDNEVAPTRRRSVADEESNSSSWEAVEVIKVALRRWKKRSRRD